MVGFCFGLLVFRDQKLLSQIKSGAMGLHFWLLEDLGGKAATCEEASSIKLLQVNNNMFLDALASLEFNELGEGDQSNLEDSQKFIKICGSSRPLLDWITSESTGIPRLSKL